MNFYSVYLKEKEIVYTASVRIEARLKDAGFTHLLSAKGGIEMSGDGFMVRSGQDWEKEQGIPRFLKNG